MARQPHDPATLLRIRKYPNRRYYDSTRSRHLTLEEIYNLIRKGHEIQVTDSHSGTDITAKVLAQIIIELDSPKLSVFPVGMLHRLLQSNEKLIDGFVHQYFNQPLTNFLNSQRNVERYLRQAIGLKSNAPTVADLAKMMLAPMNAASPEAPGAPGAPEQDLRHVIAELRHEVAELRASASSRRAGRRAPTKRSAKSRQKAKSQSSGVPRSPDA